MNATNSRLSFAVLILSLVLLVGGGLVFAANAPQERVSPPVYAPPVGVSDGGFYFSCELDCGFDMAVERVRNALTTEGFSIVSEIDYAAVLQRFAEGEPSPYLVLGICNAELAYAAHIEEQWIGVMEPYTVVVRQTREGTVAVAVRSPAVLPSVTRNSGLRQVSGELTDKALRVLAAL